MDETEILLMGIVAGLQDRHDRGPGYDHGSMNAEAAWYSMLEIVADAIRDTISERRRKRAIAPGGAGGKESPASIRM